MTGIQFRRYVIKPSAMADFLEWWHRVVPIREEHGFTLLFALQLPEAREFVSAWQYSGRLDALEASYYSDQRRAELTAESHRWAARYAAEHGDPSPDADTIRAAYTDGVYIGDAEIAHPGQMAINGYSPTA
jgi:hypothetical protein